MRLVGKRGGRRRKFEEVYGDIGVTITRDQVYAWGSVIHLFP